MAPRALTRSLTAITRPILEKRGAAFATLVGAWSEIVGPRLAADTAVDRLAVPRDKSAGVLHLRVSPAIAIEIQHVAPQLIERVNAALGYAAVARIAMIQMPMQRLSGRRRGAGPLLRDSNAEARAAAESAVVEDPELRESLRRLGAQVHAKRAK